MGSPLPTPAGGAGLVADRPRRADQRAEAPAAGGDPGPAGAGEAPEDLTGRRSTRRKPVSPLELSTTDIPDHLRDLVVAEENAFRQLYNAAAEHGEDSSELIPFEITYHQARIRRLETELTGPVHERTFPTEDLEFDLGSTRTALDSATDAAHRYADEPAESGAAEAPGIAQREQNPQPSPLVDRTVAGWFRDPDKPLQLGTLDVPAELHDVVLAEVNAYGALHNALTGRGAAEIDEAERLGYELSFRQAQLARIEAEIAAPAELRAFGAEQLQRQRAAAVTAIEAVREEAAALVERDDAEIAATVASSGDELVSTTTPRSAKARIEANLAAIRTMQELEEAQRTPTAAEREVLRRWTSWGAASHIFDDTKADLAESADKLRELIGADAWKQAQRTVLNAHYTDPEIAAAIWEHMQSLGFRGGDVLEPGSGAGIFLGLAPTGTAMTGVELDSTTARISRLLNPDATVRNESFADTRLPEGSFDAAIGNVPFSSAVLHDPMHNRGEHSMHNHFILKSLALVKPGGIVAVITSSFTMDAQNPAARREIATHADFLGAVRLPTGAHRRTAGTDALTDVVVLRRRGDDEPNYVGGDFERTTVFTDTSATGEPVSARLNEYFTANPDMVLGELHVGHGMYSNETLRVERRGDIGDDLRNALGRIAERAVANGAGHAPRPLEKHERRAAAAVRGEAGEFPGHLRVDGGGFLRLATDGTYVPAPIAATQAEELRALLGLRDTTVALLTAEAESAEDSDEIVELRQQLNRRYDDYTGRYGAINRCSWHPTGRTDESGEPVMSVRRPPVMRHFRDDPHAPTVMALEDYDATTDTATKMAIMRQRVVAPRSPRLGADTPQDALAICLDTHGTVELDAIARLLGVDEQAARDQLRGMIFADPDQNGRFVTAAEYLSGDVRAKLARAEEAAAEDPGTYGENLEPLIGVIPPDLGPAEIDAQLGAAWIGRDDVEAFLQEVLSDNTIRVKRGVGSEWSVTGGNRGVLSIEVYGTRRVPAPHIAQSLLRQSAVRVYDEDPEGNRHFNPTETEAANSKGEELNDRFAEWVWENPVRAKRLADDYNRRFNNLVLRNYDTTAMSLPGLSKVYTPRPHQLAAVARMIAEPNVGLFHAVGAGKTLEMAMGAMELKRLGLVNKPAIVVPNHMLDQFSREFLQAYPQARLLAAGTEDLAGEKRRSFVARATTGDWDAVVMTRGSFHRLEVSNETAEWYFDREIEPRRAHMAEMRANGASNTTVKRIEDAILKAEEKLKKKVGGPVDPGITFEMTGIDYLIVDELHEYKNLATDTNIQSAAIAGSQRAQNLHMKVEYLRNAHGGRALTGATATPIANSITEAYVMQRYLRPDLLEDAGISNFDEWAATFGKTKTELEMSVDGGSWSLKTRFAGFRNVPELLKMFHVAADIKLPEDLNLPVPLLARRADGERSPEILAVPATEQQLDYIRDLGERADLVRSRQVDPRDDNMLKISSDGRAAALDMRLITAKGGQADDGWELVDGDAEYVGDAGLKIGASADWLYRHWEANKDRVYLDRSGQPHPRRGALQLVFCDLGTPNDGWNVYDELKRHLVERGVPGEQIAFIHDAKNDKGKAALFAKARNGTIQVLVGSTSKMGVGTNVQDRAVSMLHVDCPWRPADIEQRDGRGVRQGNQNTEIHIARVVTEGTFDARMWSTQGRKAAFIHQFMKGSINVREVDDIGEAAMSAAEAVAIASGNPLVLEKAELDAEVIKLDRLRRSHGRSQSMLNIRIRTADEQIPVLEQRVADFTSAIERRTPTRGDAFTATIGGRWFDKRVEAGNALSSRLYKLIENKSEARWREFDDPDVGKLGGFRLQARNVHGRDPMVAVRFSGIGNHELQLSRGDLERGGAGLIVRLENAIEGFDEQLRVANLRLRNEREERARSQDRLGRPFEHEARLDQLRERQRIINAKLMGVEEKQEQEAAPGEPTQPFENPQHRPQRPDDPDAAAGRQR